MYIVILVRGWGVPQKNCHNCHKPTLPPLSRLVAPLLYSSKLHKYTRFSHIHTHIPAPDFPPSKVGLSSEETSTLLRPNSPRELSSLTLHNYAKQANLWIFGPHPSTINILARTPQKHYPKHLKKPCEIREISQI